MDISPSSRGSIPLIMALTGVVCSADLGRGRNSNIAAAGIVTRIQSWRFEDSLTKGLPGW